MIIFILELNGHLITASRVVPCFASRHCSPICQYLWNTLWQTVFHRTFSGIKSCRYHRNVIYLLPPSMYIHMKVCKRPKTFELMHEINKVWKKYYCLCYWWVCLQKKTFFIFWNDPMYFSNWTWKHLQYFFSKKKTILLKRFVLCPVWNFNRTLLSLPGTLSRL
jgi:hypothetical protein